MCISNMCKLRYMPHLVTYAMTLREISLCRLMTVLRRYYDTMDIIYLRHNFPNKLKVS